MPLTISLTDLATVRRRTSATVTEVPDDAIDAIYISTTQGNSDLARTTYYTLLDLLGAVAIAIDVSDPTLPSSAKYSQRFDHLEKVLLPLWGSITGIGTAGVSVSVTNTNTYRTDSLQAEEPTYLRTTSTLGWEE